MNLAYKQKTVDKTLNDIKQYSICCGIRIYCYLQKSIEVQRIML
jgi:hypothetical protein